MSRSIPHSPLGNGAYRQLEVEILAVKQDVARMNQQVAEVLGKVATGTHKQAKGSDREARGGVNSIASEVSDFVVDAVHDATASIENTLEGAIQARPFANLALAFGLGVLVGAIRRRR